MQELILFIHVIIALVLIGLIMIQPSQGAHAGSAFGGAGGSQSVFGSQGSTSFLSKLTTYLAITFFLTSLVLAKLNSKTQSVQFSDEPAAVVETQGSTSKSGEVPVNTDVPVNQ